MLRGLGLLYLNARDAAQDEIKAGLELDADTADPHSKAEASLLVVAHSALAVIAALKAQELSNSSSTSSAQASSTAAAAASGGTSDSAGPATDTDASLTSTVTAAAGDPGSTEAAAAAAAQLMQQAMQDLRLAEQAVRVYGESLYVERWAELEGPPAQAGAPVLELPEWVKERTCNMALAVSTDARGQV